jgi:hypothetical protein
VPLYSISIHLTPPNKCSLPCVQLDVNRSGHERLKDQQKSNNFLNFLLKEDRLTVCLNYKIKNKQNGNKPSSSIMWLLPISFSNQIYYFVNNMQNSMQLSLSINGWLTFSFLNQIFSPCSPGPSLSFLMLLFKTSLCLSEHNLFWKVLEHYYRKVLLSGKIILSYTLFSF